MKASSIHEIKTELEQLPSKELINLCLKLARSKKENKELLTFLLFEAHDINGYIISVKQEIEAEFSNLPGPNIYYIKKGLRKILRTLNKYIRHAGSKEAAVEILLSFCLSLKYSGVDLKKSEQIRKIFETQLAKIRKLISELHEDLQYDYQKQLEDISGS